jgi:alpha-L-fucosidase
MFRTAVFSLALLVASVAPIFAADPRPEPQGTGQETPAQRDARMQWWSEAKFGLFIHWGIYSVPAGTHDGKKIDGASEWIMSQGKIPVARYAEYAKEFNPVNFAAYPAFRGGLRWPPSDAETSRFWSHSV